MIEQDSRLDTAPASVLDHHGARADDRCHVCTMAFQNADLRVRQIILVELRDLIEQMRTVCIVEVLARQRPRRRRQSCDHILEERVGRRFMIDDVWAGGLRHKTSGVIRLAALRKLYPTLTERPGCETIRADETHDSQRKGIRICPNALFHDSVYCDVTFREWSPVYGIRSEQFV